MQIYIHREGQQYGPYSSEQAKGYLTSGQLLPEDLAWHEGAATWTPLRELVAVSPPPPAETNDRSWIPAPRTASPAAVASMESSRTSPVSRAPARRTSSRRRSLSTGSMRALGLRNMVVGALFFVGGSVITVWGFEAASGPKGGTYVVTWGAIIFGAIRFIKGAIQFGKG